MNTTVHEGSRTTAAGEAGAELFEAFGGAVHIAEIAVVVAGTPRPRRDDAMIPT
jgi:hypothetical protein